MLELLNYERILKSNENNKFCDSCLKENPESNFGFSSCCFENVSKKETALKFAKRTDILNYLKKMDAEVRAFGNLYFRETAIFIFKNKEIEIDLRLNKEEIIKCL